MPEDLIGHGEDGDDIDFGDQVDDDFEEEGEAEMDEKDSQLERNQDNDEDIENEIFA